VPASTTSSSGAFRRSPGIGDRNIRFSTYG
jgi:hypothetical protein